MYPFPPKRNLFKKRVGGANSKIRFFFNLTAKKSKKMEKFKTVESFLYVQESFRILLNNVYFRILELIWYCISKVKSESEKKSCVEKSKIYGLTSETQKIFFLTKSTKIYPKYENPKSSIKSIKILKNMKIQNPVQKASKYFKIWKSKIQYKKHQNTQKYENPKSSTKSLKIL
jgi:hypothetical protein